jgi:hypothetical protein
MNFSMAVFALLGDFVGMCSYFLSTNPSTNLAAMCGEWLLALAFAPPIYGECCCGPHISIDEAL